jgi:hypothetical protein
MIKSPRDCCWRWFDANLDIVAQKVILANSASACMPPNLTTYAEHDIHNDDMTPMQGTDMGCSLECVFASRGLMLVRV